jgi:ADP-ribosylglycohydrolase
MKRILISFLCASLIISVFTVGAFEGLGSDVKKSYPGEIPQKDRIMGAIIGVLIGDALGVGHHWYYNLENLKKDFGPWISDYHDPKSNGSSRFAEVHRLRYDSGVRAGNVSQTGQLYIMLLESIVEKGIYDQDDFVSRVDKFFETLDGTSYSGLYTDQAIRETWKHRHDGIGWDNPKVGSNAITSEAAQMNVILAALYHDEHDDLVNLAKQAHRNTKLFYYNDFTITHSISYALVVCGLIKNVPLEEMTKHIGSIDRAIISKYAPYYDSLIQVETGGIVWDPEITFDPPHLISKVYGLHCEIQQLLPAAYYLVHRYPDDFEKAVLSAVNGGGNNMARAALTGGMSGAMVGLEGIPDRFIKGLKDHKRLLKLAERVAEIAEE